jgi:hypothetical protein
VAGFVFTATKAAEVMTAAVHVLVLRTEDGVDR